MEPIINSQVPEFKVQAFHNGEFKTVTNKDIEGKWAIFFFYPADFTFVCPTELVDIAEKYNQFKEMGVEVYSVSTDSHFVHKAWHDASESIRKITYPNRKPLLPTSPPTRHDFRAEGGQRCQKYSALPIGQKDLLTDLLSHYLT
jgi:peroxiredoxin